MATEFDRLQAALPRRYTLVRELDRGGMSRVFLARESLPDRDVAIKVLDETLSGRLGPERFVREVHVTSRLSHPYIVPIHAAGNAGGLLYYVMPYISGKSLRDLLEDQGRLSVDEALRITLQVAGALEHAHREGIVHRDIKPANILFQSGHAVVTDFGISRALHVAEGGDITQTGFAMGTPAYMSPEQAMSDEPIDARTDIYALGCVVYEMLSGRVPFRGRTPQATLARHVADGIPPLNVPGDTVSEELEAVVTRALAKDPKERFDSAAALAEALRHADARATSTVLTPERVYRSGRWFGLRRSLQAAGMLLVVAAVGFAYQAWTSGPRDASAGSLYRDSVAIMPFANRTGDPSLDYLGPSLADEISGHLSEVAGVKVIASYSVLSLWESNLGMSGLLDTLDVGHLFDGSIEYRGPDLAINALHFDADGVLVDRASFSADPALLDSLQAAAAHAVAEKFLETVGLSGSFGSAEPPLGPGRDAYLNGLAWLGQRTPVAMRTALERFTEAIELEPSYAPAYASLSNAYALSLVYMYDIGVSPYEAAGRSVALAARATELDPGEAAAHTARGYIRGLILQDLDEAASAFEAALAIAPNAPDAPSWSVRVLEARGAMAEAFREAERARALDPFHPARRLVVTGLALVNGDYPLSIREAREAMRLEPTLTLARAMEGRALALAGRGEECAGMDFGVYRVIRALCLASSGRLSEADSLVASEELALEDGVRANPEYWDVLVVQDLAAYHGFMGEASEAARWVREAYARSPFGIDARVLESALFDAVRDDPAFADAVLQGRSGVWTAVLEESARFGRSLPRP